MAHALSRPAPTLKVAPRPAPGGQVFRTLFQRAWDSKQSAGARFQLPLAVGKAALSEVTGATGGYTVPTDFSDALLTSFEEASILWPRSYQVELDSYTGLVPLVDATTVQSAGTAPWWGGALFSWSSAAGGDALTETQPAFRQLALNGFNLTGLVVESNQLLADMQPEGEARLLQMLGRAAAWYVEYALFRGTGANASQPLGLLNAPCAKSVSRGVASKIGQNDVANMLAGLLPGSYGTALWAASPTALAQVVSVNGYQSSEDPGSAQAGQMGWLLGRPLWVTDKLPALGTAGDLVLVDPAMYVVGLRQEVSLDVSAHVPAQFVKNRSVVRVTFRGDGKPLLNSTVTLPDAATTVSSVVVLAA